MEFILWICVLLIIIGLMFVGVALFALMMRQPLPIKQQIGILFFALLYGISPLLLAWGADGIADILGCTGSSFTYQCPGLPILGDILLIGVYVHWLALFTLPATSLVVLGFVFSLVTRVYQAVTGKALLTPLYRHRQRRVLAGVFSAIADRFGISLLGIRIVAVALTMVFPVVGVLAYLSLWMVCPLERSREEV